MEPYLRPLRDELGEKRRDELHQFFDEAHALVRGRTDTAFFARYWLGIDINPFQERLFRIIDEKVNSNEMVQAICPTANQVGKTVGNAIIQIKWNFYKLGLQGLSGDSFFSTYYQTLNLSPVLRQSRICMQYVEQLLTNSFSWEAKGRRYVNKCRLQNFLKSKNENLGRLEFANNSACYFISTGEDQGANIQGAQFGAIVYDECVLSQHLKDELPSKIFSRLAKYGNLLLLIASPKSEERNNSQQYFYHLAVDAQRKQSDFIYIHGTFDENQFIPEEQREKVKERLKNLDPKAYREVVMGEFLSSSDRVFPPDAIQSMWNGKKEPSVPVDEGKYLIVIDWGFADQGDKTAIGVFEYTEHPKKYDLRYAYSEKGGDPWRIMAMVVLLRQTWNLARILMDGNSLGGVAMKKMMASLNPMTMESGGGDEKLRSLEDLKLLLTEPSEYGIAKLGRLKSYYLPEIEEEFSSYRLEDKKIEQDWVMVFAMAARFFRHRLPKTTTPITINMRSRYQSLHGAATPKKPIND